MNHHVFMQLAIKEAILASEAGEVPVGAVIVKNGQVIGKGRNRKEEKHNPIYHAEIEAITDACNTVGDWRLTDSVMYVTAEPCIMCCGAIIHARISRVIFGVKEPKFGGVISHADILDITSLNHRVEWLSGVCEEEVSQLMREFFLKVRKNC